MAINNPYFIIIFINKNYSRFNSVIKSRSGLI